MKHTLKILALALTLLAGYAAWHLLADWAIVNILGT